MSDFQAGSTTQAIKAFDAEECLGQERDADELAEEWFHADDAAMAASASAAQDPRAFNESAEATIPLSSALIGDLFAQVAGQVPYRYLGSVLLVDGQLVQADLEQVLGGRVEDPWSAQLTAEQVADVRAAATPAPDAQTLISRLGDDTFVMYSGFGDANFKEYLIVHDPQLAGRFQAQTATTPELSSRASAWALFNVILIVVFGGMILLLTWVRYH